MKSVDEDIQNSMSIADLIIKRHKKTREAKSIMKKEFDEVLNSSADYKIDTSSESETETKEEEEIDDKVLKELSQESAKLIDELQQNPNDLKKKKRLITVLNKMVKLEYIDKEAKKEILESIQSS